MIYIDIFTQTADDQIKVRTEKNSIIKTCSEQSTKTAATTEHKLYKFKENGNN